MLSASPKLHGTETGTGTCTVRRFADEDPKFDTYKTKSLKEFVAAANKDNNSHFACVPRHSSVGRTDLSNILSPSESAAVPLTKEEIMKKMNKKMYERIRRKKNRPSQNLEKFRPKSLKITLIVPVVVHFELSGLLTVTPSKISLSFLHVEDIIILSSDNEDINEGPSKEKVPKEDINEVPSKEKLAPLGSSARPRTERIPSLIAMKNRPKTRVAWIHYQVAQMKKHQTLNPLTRTSLLEPHARTSYFMTIPLKKLVAASFLYQGYHGGGGLNFPASAAKISLGVLVKGRELVEPYPRSPYEGRVEHVTPCIRVFRELLKLRIRGVNGSTSSHDQGTAKSSSSVGLRLFDFDFQCPPSLVPLSDKRDNDDSLFLPFLMLLERPAP
uniref:Uncharacterized protein n=1 Tax=Tanacetum cinerariifolium TaxID=118510 RepID=A0A699HRC4_TANCI|nr:hypothetical protein [Tanacetum cinerariifolium]